MVKEKIDPLHLPRAPMEAYGVLGVTNPFVNKDSGPRIGMLISHINQSPPPIKPNLPKILTAMESQLTTYETIMPANGVVVAVHHKYRPKIGGIQTSPESIIIFLNQETGEYDLVEINQYLLNHETFGSQMIYQPILMHLRAGTAIAKGTVLAKTVCNIDGMFSTGITANTCAMAKEGNIEDGIIVSDRWLAAANLLAMMKREGAWGKTTYPLNLYGDDEVFKAYPDRGQAVREDGILMAFRSSDSAIDPILRSRNALRTVDFDNDTIVTAPPGSIVYDITVKTRAPNPKPDSYTGQTVQYGRETKMYYASIVETYQQLLERDKNSRFSPALTACIVRAYGDDPNATANRSGTNGLVRSTYKGVPLDEFSVTIQLYRPFGLNFGSKITNQHGGKGVVCAIWPHENMPRDAAGNVADICVFPGGRVSRMNPGQDWEEYYYASMRDMSKLIRSIWGVKPNEEVIALLMEYYKVIQPDAAEIMLANYSQQDYIEHIEDIIKDGITIFIEPADKSISISTFNDIQRICPPTYGPVTYTEPGCDPDTTVDPVFIGAQHILILEQSAQAPMAAGSGITQHHGLLSGGNKGMRYASVNKRRSVKGFSETESRLVGAYVSPEMLSLVMLMNNCPRMHRSICEYIMTSDNKLKFPLPDIPVKEARPLQYVNHILYCSGIKIVK